MSRLHYLFLLLLGFAASSAAVDKVVVFGDSLSDLGASSSGIMSAYKLLGNSCAPSFTCPPYVEGRISNGPIAVERLADRMGLNSPVTLQGYAIAGALTNDSNVVNRAAPGMAQQVARYFADSAGSADPNALYVVWGGPNNFASAIDERTLGRSTITSAVNDLSGHIVALTEAGARNFLVPNVADFSRTPYARASADRYDDLIPGSGQLLLTVAKELSHAFNAELHEAMASIQAAGSAHITLFEFDTLLDRVLDNPASFGFANTTDACYADGMVCADASLYLFWDELHPTTHAHSIIGDAMLAAAIPEPQTYALLVIGLAVISLALRRRRSILVVDLEAP